MLNAIRENLYYLDSLGNLFFLLLFQVISLRFKEQVKYRKTLFTLTLLMGVALFLWQGRFDGYRNKIYFFYLVGLTLYLGFSQLFLQGDLYLKVSHALFSLSCFGLVHLVLRIVYFYHLDFFIYFFIKYILFALLAFYLSKRTFPQSELIERKYKIQLLIIISLCFLTTVIYVPHEDDFSAVIYIALLCIVLFINDFFLHFIKVNNERNRLEVYNNQLKNQEKQIDEISGTYVEVKKQQHDMKNHFSCLKVMLDQGQFDEARDYFSKINAVNESILLYDCGDIRISAMLSQKLSFARNKGIQVETEIQSLGHIHVDVVHVCTVVANILDNAIEACQGQSNGRIKFELRQEKEYIFIVCRNSVREGERLLPSLETNKPDKQNHGLGLRIVRGIAREYNGVVSTDIGENEFLISIMMENTAKT